MIRPISKPKQRPLDERLKIKGMERFLNEVSPGDADIPFMQEKLQEVKANPELDFSILERLIKVKAAQR